MPMELESMCAFGHDRASFVGPVLWAVVATLRTSRECATHESLTALIFQEAVSGHSKLPAHDMTSILVSRLHHIWLGSDNRCQLP